MQPTAAKGTLLKSGNGASTEVFAVIPGVTNLSGPTLGGEFIDVTHHSSAGGYREKIPSFKEAGQVTFDLLYDDSETKHQALLTDYENRTLRNFTITLPTTGGEIWSFAAYVTSFELQASIDDAIKASVTLELTGAVTRA